MAPATPQMKLRSKQLYGGLLPGDRGQPQGPVLGSALADSLALSPPAYQGAPDYLMAPPAPRLLGSATKSTGPATAYQSRLSQARGLSPMIATMRQPLSENTGLLRSSLQQTMGMYGMEPPKTDIQLNNEQRARDQYRNEQIMSKMQANPNGRFWQGAQLGQTVGPTGVVRPGFVGPTPETGTGVYPGGYTEWAASRGLAEVPRPGAGPGAFTDAHAGYQEARRGVMDARQAMVTQNAQGRAAARNAPAGGGLLPAIAMRNPRMALEFARLNQQGQIAQAGLQLQGMGIQNEARLGGERNALLGQQIQAQIVQQGQQHKERLDESLRRGEIDQRQHEAQMKQLDNNMAQAQLLAQQRSQEHAGLITQNTQQHSERMAEYNARTKAEDTKSSNDLKAKLADVQTQFATAIEAAGGPGSPAGRSLAAQRDAIVNSLSGGQPQAGLLPPAGAPPASRIPVNASKVFGDQDWDAFLKMTPDARRKHLLGKNLTKDQRSVILREAEGGNRLVSDRYPGGYGLGNLVQDLTVPGLGFLQDIFH